MKGYIIGIYALEDLFMIQFFKFIRIGIMFPKKTGVKGIFIGFGKLEFQFTISVYPEQKWKEVGHA
jgi:hypothetical protein|tara:strand:+ start:17534 stop:17731 length:198 start_codon:yes stop_codon:yes gene_type:complete